MFAPYANRIHVSCDESYLYVETETGQPEYEMMQGISALMSEELGSVRYIDSRTKETFSLEMPIWRSSSGNPLMLTPLPGIRRDDVELATRSIWRYHAALPLAVESPIFMGEGCTPLIATE